MAKTSTSSKASVKQNPARRMRIILGVLLGLNVVATGLVLYPPGGSSESLEVELANLQSQVAKGRAQVNATRDHAAAVEKGRATGDQFQGQYFLGRRIVQSTLVAELTAAEDGAGIKNKGLALAGELIDGSDTLGMITITANYEGTYKNLLALVRELDRSKNLLIIESLNAAPQPTNNTLVISMKLNPFYREEPELPAAVNPVAPLAEVQKTGAVGAAQ
jgi:hypothetical protein